jgi:hypothetical protein
MYQKNLKSVPQERKTAPPAQMSYESLMRLFATPAGETYISLTWATFVLAIAETATPQQFTAIAGMLPVERDDLLQAVVEGISEQIASNIDPWVRAGLCQAVPA